MSRVRPATAGDLPGIAAILAANDEAVDWPDRPGWPYLDHLLAAARVPVADGHDGRLRGFGGSIPFGAGARFLTDLFVDPTVQERGVGGALLDDALAGAAGQMTNSSADPRALALYVRRGMRPWWPLLYVTGDVARLPAPGPASAIRAVDVAEAAARASEWAGVDRASTYAYFAGLPEAAGFAVELAGAAAAVGWAHRARDGAGRTLAHLLIAPDADPVDATIAAWHAASPKGGTVHGHVPGPHPAAPILLEAGVRITDRDQFCATDRDLLDPARILPDPSFL